MSRNQYESVGFLRFTMSALSVSSTKPYQLQGDRYRNKVVGGIALRRWEILFEMKNAKCLFQAFSVFVCWGTRTRTKNDRTRICSVTITPYPNVLTTERRVLNCGCKGAKVLLFPE